MAKRSLQEDKPGSSLAKTRQLPQGSFTAYEQFLCFAPAIEFVRTHHQPAIIVVGPVRYLLDLLEPVPKPTESPDE